MTIEQDIEERLVLAELPVSSHTTLLVLEELRRIEEGKSIGTIKGKKDPLKQQHVLQRQDQKRFVSSLRAHAGHAAKLLLKEGATLERQLLALVAKYRAGKITFRKLKTETRKAISASTEMAFRLGVKAAGIVGPTGSTLPLTSHEQRWLKSYLKEELKHWNDFLGSVVSGQSEKKNAQRIRSYARTIKSAYESGRVLSVGDQVIIHWELEHDDPCPDCRLIARYSPYTPDTLPTTPKGGQTRCLSNCYCSLRIVKDTDENVEKVRKKNKTAQWYLKKIQQNRKRR